jgi:hypothetical protein
LKYTERRAGVRMTPYRPRLGGTPCVVAHSLTRALYGSYGGALYRVRNNRTGREQDVRVMAAGGVADVKSQASHESERTCCHLNGPYHVSFTIIYTTHNKGRLNDSACYAARGYRRPPSAGGRRAW